MKKQLLIDYSLSLALLIILTGLFSIMSSCGGGGGGGDGSAHAPVISNLFVSPQNATLNQDGGEVAVTMSHYFSDAGGDISTFTISVYDSATLLDSATQASSAAGYTSGNLTYTGINIPTTIAMTYKFEIYLTDATGAQSNKLEVTFVVQ